MSESDPVLVWFRDDLRIADNPALTAAARDGRPVALLYVLDDATPEVRPLGAAARWWLHRSLAALTADLQRLGHTLVLRSGPAAKIVPAFARKIGAGRVFWNRRYGPPAAIDEAVIRSLKRAGIESSASPAALLHEPGTVLTKGGTPFRTFTGFWRAALALGEPRAPLPTQRRIRPATVTETGETLPSLGLLPAAQEWVHGIDRAWQPGERDAAARLDRLVGHLATHADARDRLDADSTSRLSPSLRFGEISPFQIWHAIASAIPTARDTLLSGLGRREFAWHVLQAQADIATKNLNPAFDRFRWEEAFAESVWAWRRGRTGYPIVDAGMRQLWQTGWMHERVRVIVASFLVKHLLFDWRLGEEWFWDTLVDADPASNSINWQRVAGSGIGARRFTHISNPAVQGETFDPGGDYVRLYVPELARMPARTIHRPWQAPISVLNEAGVFIGRDYPRPMIDHAFARRRALEAFARLQAAD